MSSPAAAPPDPSDAQDKPAELAKMYSPADTEHAVRSRWESANAFAVEPTDNPNDPTYSIVIPPPNVTAALHLGHALNNTLQDVLTRYHRMIGDRTLWMPGTDHAGIATQTVVEKRLLSQGIKRLDMGRDAFVEKTQEWKDEYEGVILEQLQAMGASCDYDRTRFTMDDMCATAVRHAFFVLFQDGLIYRGKRLVNWDPVTRTALADDEVEMEEVEGHMWYLKYPLADGSGHVTVATTRPETMLGDTAVAVNPNDPLAESVRGKEVLLPIVGRTIPIVEDDYVVMADPEGDAKARIASGFLKVTPAHDTNDWDIGLRHDLPIINVMGPDGGITDKYGWDDASDSPDNAAQQFIGLSREDARAAIVAWFDANGLLDRVIDYTHSVGHSYRSHVPIEPWLSDQWYVAVTDDKLRGAALRSQVSDQAGDVPDGVAAPSGETGDGGLRFHPPRYARTFHSWHDNIRDWCISRQLWWGHQIPVWNRTVSLAGASPEVAEALSGADVDAAQPVESSWVSSGAAHLARLVTADEVEESVCVPPASSLDRLDRTDDSMDEAQLVAALEADGYVRDPDVLDTWFSSGLWPMSTMGWPWPEDFPETVGLLESFNPTSLLTTAREIITLWVSRMVMFNRYFMDGQLPFDDVFIHAMIQDGHGQKMSKSLGNGVDPRDIIHTHGADAMRFSLTQMTTDTQDLRMPVDMICPHTDQAFTPEFITTSAGHTVAAPVQNSPAADGKTMASNYGVAVGLVEATDDQPLARNTSAKFDVGRNFANKVWNATRFALGSIAEGTAASEPVNMADTAFVDRWIVSRLAETTATIDKALENYQFNVYADTLYHFVWDDFCDNYLEAIKPTVRDTPSQQVVLGAVLDSVLRLMHPVCPFVTEGLWANVTAARFGDIVGVDLGPAPAATDLLVNASWPVLDGSLVDTNAAQVFARSHELATDIRRLRAQRAVKPKQKITLHVDAAVQELIDAAGGMVETLAVVGEVHSSAAELPQVSSAIAFEGSQVIVSDLVEEIDLDAEAGRLDAVIADLEGTIKNLEGRLSNDGYVNNAKPELVQESRDQLVAAQADLAAATTARDALN